MSLIKDRFLELGLVFENFEIQASDSILKASHLIAKSFRNGKKILICGNGGSAADAQHFAAEFVNSLSKNLIRPGLPAISLASDSSVITSIANDINFEQVFSRQVDALGNQDDILIVITTSGLSKNCLNAINTARSKELKTIAITRNGAKICSLVDLSIEVPSNNAQHIQACHLVAYHMIVEIVEQILFNSEILDN